MLDTPQDATKCNKKLTKIQHLQFQLTIILDMRSDTSPLRENTPSGAPVREHETSPHAPLSDFDDRLPCTSVAAFDGLARTLQLLFFAHQSQHLAAWSLDR